MAPPGAANAALAARSRLSNPRGPWYEEEDARLIDEFNRGASLEQLGEMFQRTSDGIAARLVRLGAEGPSVQKSTLRNQISPG